MGCDLVEHEHRLTPEHEHLNLDASIREEVVLNAGIEQDFWSCRFLITGDRPELAQIIMILHVDCHTGEVSVV
jgi:hypothetical protein